MDFISKKILGTIYLWLYAFYLSFSILKVSNISSPLLTLSVGIIVAIIIVFNVFVLLTYNKNRCVLPIILVSLYFIFLILFRIKIATIQEVILVLLCYNINLISGKSFIKCNFTFNLIPFLFVAISCFFGFIPNIATKALYMPGFNKGNGLGFEHPNITGEIIIGVLASLFIVLSYYEFNNIRHSGRIYLYIMGISVLISFIFYKITNCRELLYFEVITFTLFLGVQSSIVKKISKILILPVTILIPSLTIYWDYNYNSSSKIYKQLDKWLSERLSIQNGIIQEHPFRFLQSSKHVANLYESNIYYGESNYILDNSFVNMIEIFGILGLIIAAIIIIRIMVCAIHIKSYTLCVLLLSLVLCACTESSLFNTYLDAPFMYTCLLYFKYKSKRI